MSFAGWSASDIFDVLIKLSPALTIIFGLFAAQVQWRRQQHLNAMLIAKNHYRKMLEQLTANADLLARGMTPELLEDLRKDPVEYARYRLLFAQVSFALQEIFFATDPVHEKHWAQVIRLFFEPFQYFRQSELFTDRMSSSIDPRFDAFVETLWKHQPSKGKVDKA